MLQLYLLSVLINGICGFFLYFGSSKKNDDNESPADTPVSKNNHRLIIGIIGVIIGFLKLLRPVDILIVGDIIPAIGGMLGGFVLIYDYYREIAAKKETEIKMSRIAETFVVYKKIIGLILFIIAGLHFLLPDFLLL